MGTGRQAGTEEEGAARLAAAAVEWAEPWTCVRWPLAESGREHARATELFMRNGSLLEQHKGEPADRL